MFTCTSKGTAINMLISNTPDYRQNVTVLSFHYLIVSLSLNSNLNVFRVYKLQLVSFTKAFFQYRFYFVLLTFVLKAGPPYSMCQLLRTRSTYYRYNESREENRSTRRKPWKHMRDLIRNSLESTHQTIGFSGERHNALTACATRAHVITMNFTKLHLYGVK